MRALLLFAIALTAPLVAQTAPAPPATAATLPPGRIRVSSGVMAGQIVSKVQPVFPPMPRDAKLSGSTVLHAVIGRDGSVLEVTPISGPEVLRKSVIDTVRRWRYKPFLWNGEPVEVDTTIVLQIDFGG